MYIKMLNVNKDKSKRLWLIILGAVTIASLLIFITMYLLFLGDDLDISKNDDNIENIFNLNSYNYGCNATVISNKTKNKYYIEEEYERNKDEKENFLIKTNNELGDEITYRVEDNSLKITSTNQISEYTLSNYVVKKTNLLSLATFISIYNDVNEYIKENETSDNLKLEVEEIEKKVIYRIIFNNYDLDILSKYKDILNDSIGVKKMELVLSKDTKKPLQYIVYNKDDIGYIDIGYTFFDINNNFK